MRSVTRRDALTLGAAGLIGATIMPAAASATQPSQQGASAMQTCCPIVELRQYTLHPGTRERFRQLFESTFIEPQEAVGIRIIGQFQDLDDPDRFVWMRGWADMPARAQGLTSFYDSDLWHQHRNDANACINDSDNVLLMRSVDGSSGFSVARIARRPTFGSDEPKGHLLGFIHYLDPDQVDSFSDFFGSRIAPALDRIGLSPIARFRSGAGENNFPRLPVRSRETVFAWFAARKDPADGQRGIRAYMENQHLWREGASDPILHQLERKAEILRLVPMQRSALRALPGAEQ